LSEATSERVIRQLLQASAPRARTPKAPAKSAFARSRCSLTRSPLGLRASQEHRTSLGTLAHHAITAKRSAEQTVGDAMRWLSPASEVTARPLQDYTVEPCHRPWDWDPSVLIRVQRAVAAAMELIRLQRHRTGPTLTIP
jgi:hypothetical protein